MNKSRIKRILHDIIAIDNDPIEGIYISYDDVDISNVKALIIGPNDTPYEGGFYLFDIIFPNEYPHLPPKVLFKTTNGKIRFNPNLYENGKVCLSLLGTWSGPQWTSVQTLRSVLISIQSILNENPIINEPGFEKTKIDDTRCTSYNRVVQWHNYNFAIFEMLKDCYIPEFHDIINNYFYEHHNDYFSKLIYLKSCFEGEIYNSLWGMNVRINYANVINNLSTIYSKIESKKVQNVDCLNKKCEQLNIAI